MVIDLTGSHVSSWDPTCFFQFFVTTCVVIGIILLNGRCKLDQWRGNPKSVSTLHFYLDSDWSKLPPTLSATPFCTHFTTFTSLLPLDADLLPVCLLPLQSTCPDVMTCYHLTTWYICKYYQPRVVTFVRSADQLLPASSSQPWFLHLDNWVW